MVLVLLVSLSVVQDPGAQTPLTGPGPAEAYHDSAAQRLVANARARRERAERLVANYHVTVKQRIGVGVRAFRRDRLLFGQEIAARIDWQRDGPTRVTVLGARQRVPVAIRGDHVPDDLDAAVTWMVFDPAADYLRVMGDEDDEGFVHPLRAGSEADYRFRSGDSTVLRLPDGRTIRVLELRVEPRRADFRLVAGSFWFDAESFGLVRAVFRPARPFEFHLDVRPEDRDEVPGWVNPKAEVRYVTLEYGLFDFRFWLPRFWALEAEGEMAGIRVPLRFERVYEDYRIQGGTPPVPGARAPAGTRRWQDDEGIALTDSVRLAVEACVERATEAAQQARERPGRSPEARAGALRRRCRREILGPWPVEVTLAHQDTAALLTDGALGAPVLQMADVTSAGEWRAIAQQIGRVAEPPWRATIRLPDRWHALLRHVRYNRVEALSVGLGGTLDLGRVRFDALGRVGVADRWINAEFGLTRPTAEGEWRVGVYRRLEAANPETRPLSGLGSFNALVLGRDDGEYFRSIGAELAVGPAATRGSAWRVRGYVERQLPAMVETQWSVPHLFDAGTRFRPNIDAARADQYGIVVSLRGTHAFGPGAAFAGHAMFEGAGGDYAFVRAGAAASAAIPVGRPVLGLEVGAGTSGGEVPLQSLWFLGGPATLRGYDGGVMRGEAFWRARVELGTAWPALRATVFNDWGWAGPRAAFARGRPLTSVGVGASVLDGLIRADLARGLRAPGDWRFDLYLDGVF